MAKAKNGQKPQEQRLGIARLPKTKAALIAELNERHSSLRDIECDSCVFIRGPGEKHKHLYRFKMAELIDPDTTKEELSKHWAVQTAAKVKLDPDKHPLLLCLDCALVEIDPDVLLTNTEDYKPPQTGWAPPTSVSSVGVAGSSSQSLSQQFNKRESTAKPALCKAGSKGHWETINGPSSKYGYLLLSSERGGMAFDSNSQYALMFSSGWRSAVLPKIEVIREPGGPDIPDFIGPDEKRPTVALVAWPDMSGPPDYIAKYADWAHEQWAAGKNIQFGCYGAHGRTGTFAAMLLLKAGMAKTGGAAIDLVRKLHCLEAVESGAQIKGVQEYAMSLYGVEAGKVPPTPVKKPAAAPVAAGSGHKVVHDDDPADPWDIAGLW